MADILTPALGESVTEATIAKWTKKVGDPVKKDELLVELETDKVSLEVVSPADGVLGDIKAAEGDNVVPGTILGSVTEGASAAAAPAPAQAKAAPAAKAETKSAPAAAAPAAAPAAAAIDIMVPVMGESVAEGSMGKWLKKNGDTVKKDELLVEIETDKVAVEVSAPADGVLTIAADEGATVTPNQKIGSISGSGAAAAPAAAAPAQAPAPAAVPANTGSAQVSGAKNETLSPAVARVVGENNLDPKAIAATGPKGNITKADAIAAIGQAAVSALAAAAAPAAPRADQPREERVKMTRLRQTIARRLKESQNTAAQLTTFNEVDMTNVMALRAQYKDVFEKRHGVKLGFMSFFTKAVVAALHEIPAVNAEIDGTDIIYKNHYDIGVAVGTDKGLVVPVLRDADTLSLAGIEKGIGALGKAARDGALTMDQMQGGTFTITNGGTYGSLMSTPILNAPQSGILGMHNIVQRPMAINGEVKIRPMMYLALSYDHRIVDGKEAVTFLVRVKELLEDPARALLDL
ncbi:2-oxoglutarate dehydrogenase complex dihydrolipoyllysine-residue succinyltransferase [Brevundimonas intermedia]|uniref:Dihydrolipoyllysine-residue succinyltransferase component of 2-oxoglutarate dehydrogenase complex n=1 Tax=Brevundimonas intermedia TaxID=74315 RepID=A0A4Y9RWE8_9CAUL|nr:2-oxoglutarate dehydrogenase complex dihydrolipoyllysine-residue succinyltransferase [Brevundimonas intermedia]TFW11949.1 2-oxoglutarate dehydrogenase complex dihydrolipoyllysine-residue succinyltransferase [Brevundimonas intermedia]